MLVFVALLLLHFFVQILGDLKRSRNELEYCYTATIGSAEIKMYLSFIWLNQFLVI